MDRRKWSRAAVEEVAISSIVIGERRREKLGAITDLASRIERYGLIHPIVITDANLLVVGRRRIAAAQKLGWRKIPARRFEKMSPEERRDLELDENANRLDLSAHEMSKLRMREIKEAEAESEVAQDGPSKPQYAKGGDRAAARKLGISRQEIDRTRKHLAVAEEHPAFQDRKWKRSQVLAASEALESIPKKDQRAAVSLVTGPGVDSQSAVKMLETLSEKPAPERKAILDLYKSSDPKKQSLAYTRAAKLPPLPPDVLADLDQAIRWVDKASDRETPRSAKYESVSKTLRSLRESEEKDYERFKAAEG